MKVRYAGKPDSVGIANHFNTHGLGSVVVGWEGDLSDEMISDLEVEIAGEWKPLSQAFRDKDLITDNYNIRFFEPPTPEDRERGYTL